MMGNQQRRRSIKEEGGKPREASWGMYIKERSDSLCQMLLKSQVQTGLRIDH